MACSANISELFARSNPGRAASTRKAPTPEASPCAFVCAKTIAQAAWRALVIQPFSPFSSHVPSACRRAVVRMAAKSDPAEGSDSAAQPVASPASIGGTCA